ncbi:unnamed protein product [Onchocerca ochengi]|uniref:Uncharacterized protein n=2 Tax=Onchocerca TaxID=6281 RepID=A0A182DWJ7_ONCOC|nr:unnamed protein product [Onchocerca ochengi]
MTELPRNDNEFLKANAIKHEEGRRSDRETAVAAITTIGYALRWKFFTTYSPKPPWLASDDLLAAGNENKLKVEEEEKVGDIL